MIESKYNNLIKEGRRVGNSTRLVDAYIQELFDRGEVEIEDHYDTLHSDKFLFEKFKQRMYLEHNAKFLVEHNELIFQFPKVYFTINRGTWMKT